MMSISDRGAAGAALEYFKSQLAAKDDYYTKGNEPPGRWQGRGAGTLGLAGQEVHAEDMEALLYARDPQTGAELKQFNDSRSRSSWDLTFSADKSVSVIWAQLSDEQRQTIQRAHDRAVTAAMHHLETSGVLYTRRGHAGEEREAATRLVWAEFVHHTSRAQDPQLHTHCLVMNLTQREDGTWGGLRTDELYRYRMAAGALYRAELANELRQLGFEIAAEGKEYFRVVGVPDAAVQEFSKRRQAIERAIADGVTTDKQQAALNSRQHKQAIGHEVLFEDWQQRGQEIGFGPAEAGGLLQQAEERGPVQQKEIDHATILAGLTQQSSTFRRRDLIRAVATAGQVMGGGIARVMSEVEAIETGAEVVQLAGGRFTTREMLAIELGAMERAGRMAETSSHAVSHEALEVAFAAQPEMSDEQRNAVQHIASAKQIALIEGMAGTGKSRALGVARAAWEAVGYEVRGAALAGKAASGLKKSADIQSGTLYSLLAGLDSGRDALHKKSIVVIDEAGMVGSRQMARLFEHVERAGAKLVLVGDSGQLQPVDAGGIFRRLSKELGAAEITEIIRQSSKADRTMVRQFARGEANKALDYLAGAGRLHESHDRQALMREMVARWATERDPIRPGEALLLAATRQDVRQLNELAREATSAQGHLSGQSVEYAGQEFQAGDRVLFTRNSRLLDLDNGDLGTVRHAKAGRLVVELDRGGTRELRAEEYEHVQHGYAITTHKGQGETVDKCYVLAHESMSAREWSYVAASRHRHDLHIYSDLERRELASVMTRSAAKDTALDHLPVHAQEYTENHTMWKRIKAWWAERFDANHTRGSERESAAATAQTNEVDVLSPVSVHSAKHALQPSRGLKPEIELE